MIRYYGPIYIAKYARDNYLLYKSVWKHITHYAKNTKTMNRLLDAAKAKHHKNTVKIKFGMNIPRNHKEAMMFDANNGKKIGSMLISSN